MLKKPCKCSGSNFEKYEIDKEKKFDQMLITKIRSFLLIRLRHSFIKTIRGKKTTDRWQKDNKRFECYKKRRIIADYEKIKERNQIY